MVTALAGAFKVLCELQKKPVDGVNTTTGQPAQHSNLTAQVLSHVTPGLSLERRPTKFFISPFLGICRQTPTRILRLSLSCDTCVFSPDREGPLPLQGSPHWSITAPVSDAFSLSVPGGIHASVPMACNRACIRMLGKDC